jgi:hypothetical protein
MMEYDCHTPLKLIERKSETCHSGKISSFSISRVLKRNIIQIDPTSLYKKKAKFGSTTLLDIHWKEAFALKSIFCISTLPRVFFLPLDTLFKRVYMNTFDRFQNLFLISLPYDVISYILHLLLSSFVQYQCILSSGDASLLLVAKMPISSSTTRFQRLDKVVSQPILTEDESTTFTPSHIPSIPWSLTSMNTHTH